MSERQAFYAAIRDDHEDDTPRLVFADWLEENGEGEYAAFIRDQCFAEDLSHDADERAEAQRRYLARWHTHRRAWTAALPPFDGIEWMDFRRGFPESIAVQRWEDFLRALPRLWEQSPVAALGVRSGNLVGEQSEAEARILALAEPKWLHPLRNLHIADPDWADRVILALFRAGCFRNLHSLAFTGRSDIPIALVEMPEVVPNLRRLNLSVWRFGEQRWPIRSDGKPWPSLEVLNLSMCGVHTEVDELLRSKQFPRLRELTLSMNHIDERFAAEVTESGLTSLQSLNLGGNQLGDRGVSSLARLRGLENLEELYLANNTGFGAGGVQALATSERFPRLHTLTLSRNALGDQALHALKSARWPLRELRLDGNRITAEGIPDLIASPCFSTLTDLELSDNPIGNRGIEYLTQSTPPLALRSLHLRSCQITARGAARLAEWPVLDQLLELELHDNLLGSDGARALFRSRYFSRLRSLSLTNCGITSDDIAFLFQHPHLPNLASLSLYGNDDLDMETVDRLQSHFDDRVLI